MYRKKMSRKRSTKVFRKTAMKVKKKKTLSLCEAVIEYNNEMLSPLNGLQNRW